MLAKKVVPQPKENNVFGKKSHQTGREEAFRRERIEIEKHSKGE